MKHPLLKTLVCLTAVTLLAFGFAANVSALESKVVLEGTGDLVSIPGNDLFTELKDMMPGDVGTQEILLHNEYNKRVRLYLKTEAANFLSQEKREISERLLDAMTLKLVLKAPGGQESVLYEGKASGPEAGKEISLGTYSKGAKGTITATLTIPATLGNEFQDAQGKVKWTFYCKEVTSTSSRTDDDSESDISVIQTVRMPETGGFPVEALLPMGAVLLVGGLVLGRKKR